mmetsp:Transcript_26275/g.43161  ORF Transcript_26275/g.43161 Transcript_26275/m.43161 type:complete len:172 (+) Transcript_26275:3-518(+)
MRDATRVQLLVSFLRIAANVCAIIALPWSIYVGDVEPEISGGCKSKQQCVEGINGSVWLAALGVCFAVLSVFVFFYMEYRIRYNFDPALGVAVCVPFRDYLMDLYHSFRAPSLGVEAPDKEEKECWGFVARHFLRAYRFDTVLAADRFGTIFSFIQGGNVPSLDKDDSSYK